MKKRRAAIWVFPPLPPERAAEEARPSPGAEGRALADGTRRAILRSLALSPEEARVAMGCAIGRLFRIGMRPAEPDDGRAFADIRVVVLEAGKALGLSR